MYLVYCVTLLVLKMPKTMQNDIILHVSQMFLLRKGVKKQYYSENIIKKTT